MVKTQNNNFAFYGIESTQNNKFETFKDKTLYINETVNQGINACQSILSEIRVMNKQSNKMTKQLTNCIKSLKKTMQTHTPEFYNQNTQQQMNKPEKNSVESTKNSPTVTNIFNNPNNKYHLNESSTVKDKKIFEKILCKDMEGKIIPKISLKDSENFEVVLQTEKQQNQLVLAFQPVDHLKWEIEFIKTFEEKKQDFEKLGAKLCMVSTDAWEKHKQFKTKQKFTVTLLSDADKKLIEYLGTKNDKGRYLRHVMICDTSGKCVKHFKDINVKDDTAEPVLKWIKQQKKN